MKKSLLLLGLLCAGLFQNLSAQVKTNFNNNTEITASGRFAKSYKPQYMEVPIPDVKAEKSEPQTEGDKLLKIAKPVAADIDVVRAANWTNDGQFAYGKLTLRAKGAQSLSVNFDRFYLPAGTELYVYNEKGNMITGPVTETENNAAKVWGSWVYKGEYLTVEIKTYAAAQSQLQLHISNIAYGYREIYKTKVFDFGASGACNVNVICASPWANERNAVALILGENGGALCSGAMVINNGCNTTPYFLTANHCFNASQNVGLWRFTFQAWSPTCTPSQNSNGVTFNGSTLRANWATSDFCLVELSQTPPATSGITYAGWTKSIIPASSIAGIHHPQGDVMKISRVTATSVKTGYLGASGSNHWQVNWTNITNGITEGGSSGSPLFDQDHKIRGQLHGGYSSCTSSDLRDWYGAFEVSFPGGGTNSTRLSNWLDPNNTNIISMNTTRLAVLAGPGAPPAPSVSATPTSGPGEPTTVEFKATPMSCVTYNWYVNGVLRTSSSSNYFDQYFPCNVTRTITCSITSAFGTSPLSTGLSETGGCDRGRITLSPNPVSNLLTVSADNTTITTFDEIKIYDYQGNLKKQQKYNKAKTASINVSGLAYGTYYVEISNGAEKERRLVIIRK